MMPWASALVGVIVLKSVLFAAFSGFGKVRAFFLMVYANVLSTIPGLLIGGMLARPAAGIFIGIPALAIFIGISAKFFEEGFKEAGLKSASKGRYSIVLFLLSMFTLFVLGWNTHLARPELYEDVSNVQLTIYFLLKWVTLFAGLLTTLLITIGVEGGLILKHAPEGHINPQTIRAVVAANIWTFLIIFLIGAIIAIPMRMRHPEWLMESRIQSAP
jgi:hypothetical protein